MTIESTIDDAPCELACAIREFWPESEWDNAARIAFLESGWDAFAVRDTRTDNTPCGAQLGTAPDGTALTAEYSLGYFQINACNFPTWNAEMFFNARHNAGTAHMLWAGRGWGPWYFSAKRLGLI